MSRTSSLLTSAILSISGLLLTGCGSTPNPAIASTSLPVATGGGSTSNPTGGGSTSNPTGSGSASDPTGGATPTAATTLYVNAYGNEISSYSISQNTTPLTSIVTSIPLPIATINLPASVYADLIATDGAGNLYVETNTDIREYAAGASGSATPIRVIPMTSTTTLTPYAIKGLSVDSGGNIYVSEQNAGIAIFSSTANGNVVPTRYILGDLQPGGGLSTIQYPGQIAVDGAGNIYVANASNDGGEPLLVFGPNANGNVAPIRSLSVGPTAFAVDPTGNIYFWPYFDSTNYYTEGIAEFAAGSSGTPTPIRMIDSSWLLKVNQLAVDAVGTVFNGEGANVIGPCYGSESIYQFSPTESGTGPAAAPVAIYNGGTTGCSGGSPIALH